MKKCALLPLLFLVSLGISTPRVDAQEVDPNDSARFLAGLPVAGGSPLAPLTRDPAWQAHAAHFDQAWATLERRQLSSIRSWVPRYLPRSRNLFYMFSGPDLLYAQAFFPDAENYVLCGIEPIGSTPNPLAWGPGNIPGALASLQRSLNSVLSFSFFITKDMRVDLERERVGGTLPIFYVFLARSGKVIREVAFVGLDRDGGLRLGGGKGIAPGVRIVFSDAGGGGSRTLYYFSTDISDDGLRNHDGLLKFCAHLGSGSSFLKSASYLPHTSGFDKIRNFLLDQSTTILQDDSGIPISAYDPRRWQIRLFGSYPGPIEIFKQHYQPQLRAMYDQSHPPPLPFGMGYRFNPSQSSVIVAHKH